MDKKAIKARIRENAGQIETAIKTARLGNPYAAEPDRERLQTKAHLSRPQANAIDNQISKAFSAANLAAEDGEPASGEGSSGPRPGSAAEKIWGDTVDFLRVSFLEKGARIARAVGRVAFHNSQPQGSGFLIGEGLFLTNHHVVKSAEQAAGFKLEFDYEEDLTGSLKSPSSFTIDTTIFLTSDDSRNGLDYSLFLVGGRISGGMPLEYFGWSGLSDASDKHMLGEFANIVQHPMGRTKEVVLRENRLVSRGKASLHYVADTLPGSSGSPVFNSEWRPIALHHWGSPWADVFDEDGIEVDHKINEGIRISSIVRDIRSKLPSLDPTSRERVERALFFGGQPESAGDNFVPDYCSIQGGPGSGEARLNENGRLTLTVPVEVSVTIPPIGGSAPPASAGTERLVIPRPPAASGAEANDVESAKERPRSQRTKQGRSQQAKMK